MNRSVSRAIHRELRRLLKEFPDADPETLYDYRREMLRLNMFVTDPRLIRRPPIQIESQRVMKVIKLTDLLRDRQFGGLRDSVRGALGIPLDLMTRALLEELRSIE